MIRWVVLFMALSLSLPSLSTAVPLSLLVANPDMTLTSGAVTFSRFTYEPVGALPLLPLDDVSVLIDSLSPGLTRIRFSSFTVQPDSVAQARLGYRVTPRVSPIIGVQLETPPAILGPAASARAYEDAGYLVHKTIDGVGSTFNQGVGPTLRFGQSHDLLNAEGRPAAFPGTLTPLDVTETLQLFGGASFFAGPEGNAFVTLPHVDQLYTAIPEPSPLILWSVGAIVWLAVARLRRSGEARSGT